MGHRRALIPALAGGLMVTLLLWWAGASADALRLEGATDVQDEGGATKYFRGTPGGTWTYLTSDTFPHAPRGCGDIPQIPDALADLWANCTAGY
ncbi:hypothetical protein [Streptomyces sp. SAI-229]|uniref:hypothetical protein n=1 Tax=Streptomyces sp. SAI-229 TaxID=3377731 RepID=UPI003C7C2E80